MDGFRSLAGQLLIAAPPLVDPNFFRTVVLVIEHEPDGAVGVVLNRPGEHEAETALPDLAPVLEEGERLHEGGPVQTEAVVALGEWRGDALPESPVVGAVGLLTGGLETTELPEIVRRVRVFAGYAGWGPGQLEAELGEEAWILEPAQPADVFDPDPQGLWPRVLERKGGVFRLLARMPDDPSVN